MKKLPALALTACLTSLLPSCFSPQTINSPYVRFDAVVAQNYSGSATDGFDSASGDVDYSSYRMAIGMTQSVNAWVDSRAEILIGRSSYD